MAIKHKFQSQKPQSNDPTKVSTSQWNDVHDVDSIEFPLTDPVAPVNGSFWCVQTNSNPLTVEIRMRIGTKNYVIHEIVSPREVGT